MRADPDVAGASPWYRRLALAVAAFVATFVLLAPVLFFAVMFAAVVAILAAAVGFGVDTVQLFNAKTTLRAAVDAAVTSTARDLTTGIIRPEDADASVQTFIDANNTASGPSGGAYLEGCGPTTVVPEPITMALLATGLAGMGGVGLVRRRRTE